MGLAKGGGNAVGIAGVDPTQGERYLDLNGTKSGAISQDLAVSPTGTYTLTLDAASGPKGSDTRSAQILWDGSVVATIALPPGSGWSTVSVTLPATGADSATLSIRSTSSGTSGVYLDNIGID